MFVVLFVSLVSAAQGVSEDVRLQLDSAAERAALLESALEEREGLLARHQASEDALARRCHALRSDAARLDGERMQLHAQLKVGHNVTAVYPAMLAGCQC